MRRAVFSIIVLLALAVAIPAASAHSFLVGSDPAQGSVLATAPPRARLVFSEDVAEDLTKVTLLDHNGATVAGTSLTVDPEDDKVFIVALPPLADGTYRLRYDTRDPIDLHETSGSIVFAVGRAGALLPPEETPPGPPISVIAIRWLLLGALALVVGPLALALVTLRDGPPSVRAGLITVARIAAAGAVVLQWVLLLALTLLIDAPFGRTLGSLLSASDYGKRVIAFTLVGLGGVMLLKPLVASARENRRLGWSAPEVVSAALVPAGLAVIEAFGGHSSGRAFTWEVTLRSFHLAAAWFWVGVLASVVILATRPPGGGPRYELVALAKRLTPLVVMATGILVVTGLVLSGREIVSLTALFATQFGWTLIVKLVLLAAALALGAMRWHRFEMYLAAAVLAGGSALAAAAPAVGDRYLAPHSTEVVQPAAVQVGETLVTFAIEPGRPGAANLVSLRVASTRRPPPAPPASATVKITLPGGVEQTIRAGPLVWGTAVQLDSPVNVTNAGPYTAAVTFDPSSGVRAAHFQGEITPFETPRHSVIVSSARIETVVNVVAAVLAAALLAWAVAARRLSPVRRRE